MILKKLIRGFLHGLRRVNQKALHAGKDKSHAKAKPAASKAKSAVSKAKRVKKAAKKVKAKVQAKVQAKAKPEVPEFKRTGVNPLSAMPNDPAHSPGHRKMNWKKYQETAKSSRKAARP